MSGITLEHVIREIRQLREAQEVANQRGENAAIAVSYLADKQLDMERRLDALELDRRNREANGHAEGDQT